MVTTSSLNKRKTSKIQSRVTTKINDFLNWEDYEDGYITFKKEKKRNFLYKEFLLKKKERTLSFQNSVPIDRTTMVSSPVVRIQGRISSLYR